ncbi:MAG: hypothetical protein D6725_15580 [Planctomycetota bacterium]|nr:MAG: hypothetical protein D6725_15580 [Planctomycetota bacterium]
MDSACVRDQRRSGPVNVRRVLLGARPPAASRRATPALCEEKRGSDIGKTKAGKGMKLMLSVRRDGLTTAALVAPAQHAENQLLLPLLKAAAQQAGRPEVLLGDRAYDDDGLRDRLRAEGIFLLAPPSQGPQASTPPRRSPPAPLSSSLPRGANA